MILSAKMPTIWVAYFLNSSHFLYLVKDSKIDPVYYDGFKNDLPLQCVKIR